MNSMKAVLMSCVLLMLLLLPAAALAILYNTGLDTNGSLLSQGAIDPHWTETYAPMPQITTPPTSFGNAYANYNGSWQLANGPNSGWITPLSNPVGLGQYIYHTEFTGDTPFGGQYKSDNELLKVFLNSALITFPTNGEHDSSTITWTNFTITAGLNAGLNTLDFVVHNRGGGVPLYTDPTVTGFRAEFTSVPAPPSLLLLGSGLVGLIATRLRSRRRRG